ncbi:MAG: deoxyguanosinetriphosphate triphosphohydrolase [Candidatus Pacebacteria bacterium]|nr:deoxyguanosinetriphosphate triphosphohydrolase [Candidatus Paceibacterota bacterium]
MTINKNLNHLAARVADPVATARRYAEEPNRHDLGLPSYPREPYQRDRDRIIHSRAFRRLQHKTQVFVTTEGDHSRSRLTHSLEVAQIARSLARGLGLNEDLTEAIALAHDLGHPPFGHAGETALNSVLAEVIAAQDYSLFDHNLQSFRVITELEKPYLDFDGLNLTRASLAGICTHNGPMNRPPRLLQNYDREFALDLGHWPSLEAQVAAMADDIAYNNHDLDDGLRAGLLEFDQLLDLPLIGRVFRQTLADFPAAEPNRQSAAAVRRLVHAMTSDLFAETLRRVAAAGIANPQELRPYPHSLVGFSDSMAADCAAIKGFLYKNLYHHPQVLEPLKRAQSNLRQLFLLYWQSPHTSLPESRIRLLNGLSEPRHRARLIADYIAGMTDRFAEGEFARLSG